MNWFGIIWSLVPLLVAWRLLRQLLLTRRLRQVGYEVLGCVTRQREVSTRKGSRFVPTVCFTTHLGQVVEGESQGEFSEFMKLEFFDGDEVMLYYDPDEPARFLLGQELAGAGIRWLLGLTAGLGLLVLTSAVRGR